MDWQELAVGLIVFAAVGYLARSGWKTWFGRKAGCGSGCGACKAPPAGENEPTNRIRLL